MDKLELRKRADRYRRLERLFDYFANIAISRRWWSVHKFFGRRALKFGYKSYCLRKEMMECD